MLQSSTTTRLSAPPLPQLFPHPKVSVIMPTYNRARNLRNTLASLVRQTYREFEVLVCDDGSTDETAEVAKSFRDRLNLRYLCQEHRGFRAGGARNMGIAEARGKLLLFLDSDVIVGPEFIATHAAQHRPGRRVAVNSFVYRMTEDRPELAATPPAYEDFAQRFGPWLAPDSRERFHLFEPGKEWEQGYFLDSNALSLRSEAVEAVGGFDPQMVGWGHEDTELGLRLADAGYRFVFLKDAATGYHQYHPPSPTKEEERAANWQRLVAKHGITNWYLPLSQLAIEGSARVEETAPVNWDEVPALDFWQTYSRAGQYLALDCRRTLEVSQPWAGAPAYIKLQNGIVADISWGSCR